MLSLAQVTDRDIEIFYLSRTRNVHVSKYNSGIVCHKGDIKSISSEIANVTACGRLLTF